MSKRLKDIVQWMPSDKLPTHLRELSKKLHTLVTSITTASPRTNESVVLTNLGRRTAVELERVASFFPSPIEGVAWCTRNLFELNLVVRFVLMDPKNLEAWSGQLAGDEIQIIEGLLTLSNNAKPEHIATLKKRLTEVAEICKRHGIDPSKPFQPAELAKIVGLSDDYKALYKLFSKYIHPSAWLVNNPEQNTQSDETLNIFIIHSQLYSGDTYGRLEAWFKKRTPLH
jgi:hypothetical protein